MSGIKRAFFGYLYNLNREIEAKKKKKVDWSSEASTEAVFVKASHFEEILGYDFFSVKTRGQHNGILGFFEIKLQRNAMTTEEQVQAVETIKDLHSGEKIIYWTRGVNIHSPEKWFYKIERK